ncbi:MAG: nuclear transport factor 2 family protein [Bacteroidota bacterium]
MEQHHNLIEKFYSAFQELDAETMLSCYHEEVTFQDPVFGQLDSDQVRAMWPMLIERSGGDLAIHYDSVMADESGGYCHWEAHYTFSKTQRPVHNNIKAVFRFQDGKIIEHHDHFSFWTWASMALGLSGAVLGWSPLVRNKVRKTSLSLLEKYMNQSREKQRLSAS